MATTPALRPPGFQVDPNTQNPLLPPGAPPEQSPALGFQTWAASPMNAMKVQPSMTSPSEPLQPNASANPPAMPKQSVEVYGGQAPQVDANATPTSGQVLAPPGFTPPPAPLSPQKANIPAPMTQQQDMANDGGQYERKIMGSKLGAVLSTIAATAIGAGGGMHGQPGAGAEYAMGVLKHDEQVPIDNQQIYNARWVQPQTDRLKQQELQGNIAHTQAETTAIPVNTAIKQQAAQGVLAKNGLKLQTDENGNVTGVVPDEESPAYQRQQTQNDVMSAHADAYRAQVELNNAKTAVAKLQADPNSPQFKLAQQRLSVAQQNAAAAQQRAQAYMGRYMQSAYNKGLNGEVLPGSPVIADENGNQTVVGTANAGHAIKNQSNAAQFNDVHGALDTVENAATALTNKGGKLNDPIIAAALAQPHGTVGQWVQGAVAKGQMTPEQRDYVLSVQQAHENVQALRKSAGGTATDSAVAKLDAMIPGASTPDLDYLKRQTGQIRATAERLGKGATVSTGGLSVRGNAKTPPSSNPLTPPAKAAAGPKAGDVENGYRFKGGNPADQKSWEKVQ